MAKSKFNLLETLSSASQKEIGTEEKKNDDHLLIDISNLVPSSENFYGMTGLDELKENIQLAGMVLQNLLVVPLDDGRYKILSGHRRCAASLELVNDGKTEFKNVPCTIVATEPDQESQDLREEIVLITSNSQREKTGWEKVEEARRIRNIIEKIRVKENLGGSVRDNVAEMLNTSPTQVGRYDAIYKNLTPAFMSVFRENKINLSTAYELSGLDMESQSIAYQVYETTGKITLKEAKEVKEQKKAKQTKTPSCKSCDDVYYRRVRTENPDGLSTREEYIEYKPQFCPQCGRLKK